MVISISDELLSKVCKLDDIFDKFKRLDCDSIYVYVSSSNVLCDVSAMWQNKVISDLEFYSFLQVFMNFIEEFGKLR